MNIYKKITLVVVVLVACSAVTLWSLRDYMREARFNFRTVEVGKLYRSGLPNKKELKYIHQKYKIKTIYSFSGDITQKYKDVDNVASNLGIRVVKLAQGNKVDPIKVNLETFLDQMADSNNWPALVHCAAGADRTGWIVMSYRVVYDDWTFDRAFEEALKCGLDFEDPPKNAITKRLPKLIESLTVTNKNITAVKGITNKKLEI